MRQVYESIYRRHRQGLFTLALAITRCPDSAEDAVHDAFERLWRTRPHLAGDGVTYVYAAVRNAAVDRLRKDASVARVPVSIFNGPLADPRSEAIDREVQDRLRQAVEDLPDAQRQAIVLHVFGGLTFRQMAKVLGEPLPTVASRYRRGLETLRETVGRLR